MKYRHINVELMRHRFYYEPELGHLFYRYDPSSRQRKGDRAGYTDKQGYRLISIKDNNYLEHRIIYAIVTGHDPQDKVIHHVDGCRDNNNFYNLQALTFEEHVLLHLDQDNFYKTTSTKLLDLYGELSRVINQASASERELVSTPNDDYDRWSSLHRAISEALDMIIRIKDQITVLEESNKPGETIIPIDSNELAETTKSSPEIGIGWNKKSLRWRFRRHINGKPRMIAQAETHAEIVALKQQWEQQQ